MDSDREMANSASESTDIVMNSIENRSLEKPVWITCYINGDPQFSGKRVLYTKKRYKAEDIFYDEITRALHTNRSVKGLGTPSRGSRVRSLEELRPDEKYVALTDDRFRPLEYTSIEGKPRKTPRKSASDLPKKNPKFKDVSGKINQANIKGKKIHVWPNGEVIQKPHPIGLQPSQLLHMDNVIQEVGGKLNWLCAGNVTRLHDRHGRIIHDPSELVQDECYIAVKHHDYFRRMPYQEREKPNIMTSRNLRKAELPPLILSRGSKNSKDWSPNTSGHSSYPDSENSYRDRHRRNRVNRHHREHREEDDVFPSKPVTHKRNSERSSRRQVDLDRDEGGMFRAKQGNRHTQGAREIRETRDTKVDLPLDHVPAEEVKDERIRGKPNSDYNQKNKSKGQK